MVEKKSKATLSTLHSALGLFSMKGKALLCLLVFILGIISVSLEHTDVMTQFTRRMRCPTEFLTPDKDWLNHSSLPPPFYLTGKLLSLACVPLQVPSELCQDQWSTC